MISLQAGIVTIFDKAIKQNEKAKDRQKLMAEYAEIKQYLDEAKYEMENAENNFNQVSDPKLIDMYIYRIQSARTHYEHLLRAMKKLNID